MVGGTGQNIRRAEMNSAAATTSSMEGNKFMYNYISVFVWTGTQQSHTMTSLPSYGLVWFIGV